ncbi:MAG: SMI1/KNR4 family protein, partial [Hymenobacter sp.]
DWLPWKPIPSTVTERDLHELERRMGLRYPALYKEFLRYKHFYEFWSEQEINFFRHGIYEWKDNLLAHYFASWDPAKLIAQGYIYFADYADWGIICFDTTKQRPGDNDCPVILIDHELLYEEPLPLKTLYPSFEAMMRSLRTEQQNRVQPQE